MATNETKKATVKATGETIEVYKHIQSGEWINLKDCKTSYSKNELTFHN